MSTGEDPTYTDLVYQKLTDVEKQHYSALNRKIRVMKGYHVLFLLAMVSLLFVLSQINVLISLCCSVLYIFALNALNNELIRAKVNRILFERNVGIERKQVEEVRRQSHRKPSK